MEKKQFCYPHVPHVVKLSNNDSSLKYTYTQSHTPSFIWGWFKWILLSLPYQHRIVLGSPAAISIFILKIWTPSTSLIFLAAASLMQREWCEMERDGPFGKTTPPPATRRDAMFQLGSSSHSHSPAAGHWSRNSGLLPLHINIPVWGVARSARGDANCQSIKSKQFSADPSVWQLSTGS